MPSEATEEASKHHPPQPRPSFNASRANLRKVSRTSRSPGSRSHLTAASSPVAMPSRHVVSASHDAQASIWPSSAGTCSGGAKRRGWSTAGFPSPRAPAAGCELVLDLPRVAGPPSAPTGPLLQVSRLSLPAVVSIASRFSLFRWRLRALREVPAPPAAARSSTLEASPSKDTVAPLPPQPSKAASTTAWRARDSARRSSQALALILTLA
mmetsp:Transcript_73153/g.145092  ORF Transcript_73153/g.145092 Transcript_73153/m.145092 type:complete len:210 (-) Transcript_73153:162-791(-)